MKPHALRQLLRQRRLVLDEAIHAFGECLRDETAAAHALQAIEAAIARETEKARELDGSDATVEAFGAWFRRAREELEVSAAALDRAQAETARARAVMAAARTALEAAETLEAAQKAEAKRLAEQRAQAQLDEVAQRRRGAHG
jgi:flagellar export protein FliJ